MATKTVRPKMSVENRAKQFMPFAALKGLPEALAKKEKKVADEELHFHKMFAYHGTEKI